MSNNDFLPLGDFLQKSLGRHQEAAALTASQIGALAKRAWPELQPVSFYRGTLKVRTVNSAQAHQLKLQEEEIMDRINRLLGDEVIKRIRSIIN